MKQLLAALLICSPLAAAWPRAGGGGGGGCFGAGTLVSTTAGDVIIEALRPGDMVLAYSENGLAQVPVKEFYKKKVRRLTLITREGRVVTTPDHPFLTRHGFAEASTLKAGDEVARLKDGRVAWTRITRMRPGSQGTVYNLEVAPPHTFIANGFVVHNKGGGGYHSRSGGRAKSDLIFMLVMIPVALFLKAKDALSGKSPGTPGGERTFSREQVALRALRTGQIMQSLAASDPELAPGAMEPLVRGIFLEMQAAWQARDYSALKGRIGRALFDSHSARLEAMKGRGEINMMEHVSVQSVDFVHIRYVQEADVRSVTALITASACDYTVDERSRALLSGSRDPSVFQEFWTFQRQDGRWVPARIMQTTEDYFLTAPNMPAAPVEENSPLPAAAAGIAAAATAAAEAPAAPKPQKERRFDSSGDPWDRQRMEIAATLAFQGVYAAWEKGHPGDLQEDFIFPGTLARLKDLIAERAAEGLKFEFKDLYTGKAEIVLTSDASRGTAGMDEFTARLTASAKRALTREGKTLHRDQGPEPFTEYWVFGRGADGKWRFKDILPRMLQESGGDGAQDLAPSPVQLEWYWRP